MNMLTIFVILLLTFEVVTFIGLTLKNFWLAIQQVKINIQFFLHDFSGFTITLCVWFLICRWMNLF